MALIRICERFTGANSSARSFDATVNIDDGRAYPIRIYDPFSEEENQLLEWYFEGYPRFPFVRQTDARKAAASIPTYGEALFTQVFACSPWRSLWSLKTNMAPALYCAAWLGCGRTITTQISPPRLSP